MTRTVFVYLVLILGVRSQSCPTDSSTISMCHTGSVRGPVVNVDVSAGAEGNFTNCSCFVSANISGFYVDFLSTPTAVNCSTKLDLLFDDVSMQLRCGAPAGVQHTTGRSASIEYTLEELHAGADSSYCLMLFNNFTAIDIEVTCLSPVVTTTTSSESTTLQLPISSSTLSSALTITTSSSNTSVLINTTMPPTSTNNRSFTSSSLTDSTTQSSSSAITSTTVSNAQSNTSKTINSTSYVSTISTTQVATTNSPNATPTASTTNVLSNKTLDDNGTSTVSLNNTTLHTTSSYNSTYTTTTMQFENITLHTDAFNATTTTTNLSLHTISHNPAMTTTTSFSNPNATLLGNVSTSAIPTYSSPSTDNTITSSTISFNTTLPSSNSTDVPNITTDVFTTTLTSNNFTTAMSNTTDVPENYTTSQTLNTTESTSNVTGKPENTTSDIGNTSSVDGNVTADYNTTDPSNATTVQPTQDIETTNNGMWIPPDGGYTEKKTSSNVLMILVPILAVFLVIFITVVTYIMCKRTKKAARQTRTPDRNKNVKTQENKNVNGNAGQQTGGQKSDNPADYFVTKQNTTQAVIENEVQQKPLSNTSVSKANEDVTENLDLTKTKEKFDPPVMSNGTQGKPKVYEPTERERDLLESLELSSIVIESDPNDSNRYFRKSDPGDWYRVIMKGKKPKGETSKPKKSKKGSRKNSSQTDSSETKRDKDNHHRKRKSEVKDTKNSDRKSKSHDANDLEESTIGLKSAELSKAYQALLQSGDLENTPSTGSKSLPMHHTENYHTNGARKQSEPRVVVSKPLSKTAVLDSKHSGPEPKVIVSKPVKSTEVESKPKEPDPPKTRVIMSQPSSVKTPASLESSNTVQEMAQQINNPTSTVINSTPVRSREITTTQVQSSPARPRSNLFGPRGEGWKGSGGKPSPEPVKRPAIVPPLNLTGTGDQVEIDEDGFEGFVLKQ